MVSIKRGTGFVFCLESESVHKVELRRSAEDTAKQENLIPVPRSTRTATGRSRTQKPFLKVALFLVVEEERDWAFSKRLLVVLPSVVLIFYVCFFFFFAGWVCIPSTLLKEIWGNSNKKSKEKKLKN